jgi:MFS family permease
MLRTLRESWPLFFGILVLMIGNGLQGSLLALRATAEGFPATLIGIIMSAYYVGFLIGWATVPGMIQRVGHIRVFAAFGTVASATVLLHAVIIDPVAWFVVRLVTGTSLCAIFITAESWLNSNASNETRGQLLAIYMIVQLGGLAGGQFLLNVASPRGAELFILVSVLVSLAIVPILLSASAAPVVTISRRLSPRRLFEVSPLATVAIFAIGIAQGALYGGIGTLYARTLGFAVPAISLFMAMTITGGMLFQWPIGWLSDRFDRRLIITVVTFLAGGTSLLAAGTSAAPAAILILFLVIGGLSLPMYSLCVAHANDNMTSDEMVGASGALLLVNGIGAAAGPTLGAGALQLLGPPGFPLYLAAAHIGIGIFALWRMTRRAPVPLDAQGPTIPLATQVPTPVLGEVAQETAVERSPEGGEAPPLANAA